VSGFLWATAAGASTVTEAELRVMRDEVAPVVAEVAGMEFRELPEIVLADSGLLARVVLAEQRHLLTASGQGASVEAQRDAEETATAMAPAFAGKYGFLDHRLYVSVEGLEDALAIQGYPAWLLRPALRVVIAHELVHALQDQQVDLGRSVLAAPSGDAVMALNCLVEGHAVWVHEQVGARLGLDEAVTAIDELLGTDTPFRRRMDPREFQQRYVYGLGRDSVAWHADHGGTTAVWAVLASPPPSTAGIVAPWDDAGRPLAFTAKERHALVRAGERLAGRGWSADAAPLGDFELRDQLVRVGADQGLADALRAGFNTRVVGGAMAGVEVQVLQFDDAAGARAYVQGMRRQAEDQAERVGRDPFITATATNFDRVRGDTSAREAVTVSLFDDLVEHLGKVWVARGPHAVQVVLVNSPATDRQVAQSIESAFRAIE
jgi:hypothetical protein